MNREFNLEKYLSNGVENVVKGALKASLSNPKESIFMTQFALTSKRANERRKAASEKGEHIPPFLIASITSKCNLHCAGCYSRAIDSCGDCESHNQLTDEQWDKVFAEAEDLGISFIMLVGGEPLVRPDVVDKAAEHKDIFFPVITNGTLLKGDYLKKFDKHRNLFPVLSIEGGEATTDARRGSGVYARLEETMSALKKSGILFGASITVTTENMDEVMSDKFLDALYEKGCKSIFYIEYVPAAPNTEDLAPKDEHREIIMKSMARLRARHEDMVLIAFPGDENASSGCLAAGRGFFHINANGGAEPCPFSPYSDVSVQNVGLKGALTSPLFKKLQEKHVMDTPHAGGCVLFEQDDLVKSILS